MRSPTKHIASLRWAAGLALVSALGCATTERPYTWVENLPAGDDSSRGTIENRDTILVAVRNQTALSGEFPVGDHGEYLQPTLGTISVAGKTTEVVAADLQGRLKDLLTKPEVTVSIIKIASVRVNVVGEVRTPGSYELQRGRGVLAALAAAGWLNEFANGDKIFVIRSDSSGSQRIRFKARDLTAAEPHATSFRLKDGDVVVAE